ncbi:hypothetical protein, unlikely [Trypanosoma brucei gambiense DAL972]|uniref:Uncharacterized protein n=1 Tax=Trypanosoma brucei gambiense (strain MHOM/CI/86/DAL972) TaxID=679716 RepID=D0A7Z1_TRYB9|nr:hypothetical protein, unlikely [Trypanosoma brucei gambiense DAL972]CBH17792.1 hypothetical protein, unlikely [Trypanosoma brucei gambiense DAL972]|eukprot:XP_011780056.1 hypothetical protein, unlikely [Trypanosoma brucei gambiense DAL972]
MENKINISTKKKAGATTFCFRSERPYLTLLNSKRCRKKSFSIGMPDKNGLKNQQTSCVLLSGLLSARIAPQDDGKKNQLLYYPEDFWRIILRSLITPSVGYLPTEG